MRITENLKEKIRNAQKAGYNRVYAVVGAFKATTYCVFVDMDFILRSENGAMTHAPRSGRWTGHPNTRHAQDNDIQYNMLFKRF